MTISRYSERTEAVWLSQSRQQGCTFIPKDRECGRPPVATLIDRIGGREARCSVHARANERLIAAGDPSARSCRVEWAAR